MGTTYRDSTFRSSTWGKRLVFASLALGYIEIAIVLLVLVWEYCYYFVIHVGEPLNLP
jgi:hypothetical protein